MCVCEREKVPSYFLKLTLHSPPEPPVKSLVSVTVHEPPSLVYTHHPIQGRCASGWVDQAASIILRVSNPHTPLGYIISEGSAVPIGNTSSDLMPVDVQTGKIG